jgi:hypothetical protein
MLSECPHLHPGLDSLQAVLRASHCAQVDCSWWEASRGCACLMILPARALGRDTVAAQRVPA